MTAPDTGTDSPRSPEKKDTGKWGEIIARNHLIKAGYAIVETGWRSGHYEIDIVAQKGARIVFVEVKTRKSADVDPVSAVNSGKMRRIIRAADTYLRSKEIPLEYQFDIITVTGTPADYTVEHIPDAYFPSVRLR